MAQLLIESIQAERRAAVDRQIDLRALRAQEKPRTTNLAMRVLRLRPA